jgi:hypothetical protein
MRLSLCVGFFAFWRVVIVKPPRNFLSAPTVGLTVAQFIIHHLSFIIKKKGPLSIKALFDLKYTTGR